jgi:micrococcal nuclease
MYQYEVDVLRVVDGDTIDVMVDLGFDIKTKKRVRLYGINAPETRTRDKDEKVRGYESKEFLINFLKNKQEIILNSLDIGKYGRVVGEIIVDGINANKLRHNTHFVEKNFYYIITKSIFGKSAFNNFEFI